MEGSNSLPLSMEDSHMPVGYQEEGGKGGVTALNWSVHYFDEKFRETVAAIRVFQLSV